MAPLKVGDKFPDGVKFEWAPITDPDPTACGIPQEYNASKEFAGKKVVVVSVPGMQHNTAGTERALTLDRRLHTKLSSLPHPTIPPEHREARIKGCRSGCGHCYQ